MGTYCELYVADCQVFSWKSKASPIVMTLFRERDKRVYDRKCNHRNRIGWSHGEWDDAEMERVVEYTATVREVCDRLAVMGFSLSASQADFEREKSNHVEELQEMNEGEDFYKDEIALLERSSFSDFLEALREIVTSGIHPIYFREKKKDASELASYLLHDREGYYWGFPCTDIRSFFRALLEVVPDSSLVTQDLTDLVAGSYYAETDEVCESSLRALKGDYAVNSRIILLTEGTTDSEVLRAAIALLFPHLLDYYSFMDLAARAPGGASSLVHAVKAFAGAGIENRTIALFDNDAAGHGAAQSLSRLTLPSNICVMTYPDISSADSYPTQGPNGESLQNVNGSACSIELFFGRDVLTINGQLVPVQWKAYDERVRRYQGEVQHKDLLKDRFMQKVRGASQSGTRVLADDWADMNVLLQSVFGAFDR